MQCDDCGAWLTSADVEVGEDRWTYSCGKCGAHLPPEQARTELFAWV